MVDSCAFPFKCETRTFGFHSGVRRLYIPAVCPECPLPSKPVGAAEMSPHSWNQCCEDVAPRRGQVGRRRKTRFSKSRSFNATQFNSYSNLASALKVKGAVKNGWQISFLSKNIVMASCNIHSDVHSTDWRMSVIINRGRKRWLMFWISWK